MKQANGALKLSWISNALALLLIYIALALNFFIIMLLELHEDLKFPQQPCTTAGCDSSQSTLWNQEENDLVELAPLAFES